MSGSTGVDYGALFDVSGRVAVVTGGAGLLGEVHARALLANGAIVVLTDIDSDKCRERAAILETDAPGRIVALHCDVSRKESWEELLDEVMRRFGRVDVLVNNAGYTNRTKTEGYSTSFAEVTVQEWQRLLEVNLTGVFLGCQVIGSRMRERSSGSIVNIASMYGLVSPHHPMYAGTGVSQPIGYSVSKAGVLAITRYLATLWAREGVRVNAITPGGIYDGQAESFTQRFCDLNPMGRMGDRAELAGAVVYLASDASSYCTGHNLVVDGGWTVW